MKLKNKTTNLLGKIVYNDFYLDNYDERFDDVDICVRCYYKEFGKEPSILYQYDNLEDLYKEWEDYKEPKGYWYIDFDGCICGEVAPFDKETNQKREEIGNVFSSEEEAEKAVEKLKAWKRLKDKGFEFTYWKGDQIEFINECPNEIKDIEEFEKDLDLLFGGEE